MTKLSRFPVDLSKNRVEFLGFRAPWLGVRAPWLGVRAPWLGVLAQFGNRTHDHIERFVPGFTHFVIGYFVIRHLFIGYFVIRHLFTGNFASAASTGSVPQPGVSGRCR